MPVFHAVNLVIAVTVIIMVIFTRNNKINIVLWLANDYFLMSVNSNLQRYYYMSAKMVIQGLPDC